MAWIELHQSLPTHRRTLLMADHLDLPPVCVVGHLACLWLWAVDNAEDGVLPVAPRIVARAAQWAGEPQAFWDALLTAGFIDGEGRLHNWGDYAGRLIAQRKANAQRMRDTRAAHVQRTFGARTGATVPNRTVPPPTTPRERGPAPPARGAAAAAPTSPAVQEANKLLHKRCDETERAAVNAAVPDTTEALRLWVACLSEWRLRYPNNRGLSGPLDWFGTGGPPQKRQNGRPGAQKQSVVANALEVIGDELDGSGPGGTPGGGGRPAGGAVRAGPVGQELRRQLPG